MIADALFSLMKRKPFQQITVTEVCDEAAVGRKTFYRNFELREDVIDFWLDLRCEECREVLLTVPLEEQLYHYCIFLKKHMDVLIVLYQNGLHPLVEKKFSVFMPYTMPTWSEDPVEQEYRSQYPWQNKSPGTGFVIITLPIPGFVSVVCFTVCRFSGDGVYIAPGLSSGLVKFALFLLGKLLIGDEFFHTDSSFWFLKSVYHNWTQMHKRIVNPDYSVIS